MPIIATSQLRKSYGDQEVLHGIDLAIPAGKLVGFLGPNGAGKTTTIRILLGLIHATSGSARIFGQSCWEEGPSIRNEVGYLPGDVHFYPTMTGAATLRFFARARSLDCASEITRLAQALDLNLHKTVRNYSSGMKQKLALIQALMHRPKLLVLDEPTNGLDPLVRQSVFDELRSAKRDGRTVLFSSHTLSEVEELCDEVIILRNGHVIEHQEISTLRSRALRHVEITFAGSQPMTPDFPEELHLLKQQDRTLIFTWSGKSDGLIAWLGRHSVSDVTIAEPSLDDLFMAYYESSDC
jgi:ABC-2 type transport system ATP-binding protein